MTIVSTDDTRHGVPRVEGTRITVIDVYRHVVEFDKDPAVVADKFDITLGDVHEAIAYYYNHPDEMRRERDALDAAHRRAEENTDLPES